jgi:hypothetical protein
MLFVFIIILFMNLSCAETPESKNKGILLKAGHDFSDMPARE